ncbi:hypothetical protein GE09DRAFT_1040577 [Coniochaeta sp. 2T2.1]|nr:hypothetical protein GE09DRAFT_1040577 [Coniochaeta sp. 2T2.1]
MAKDKKASSTDEDNKSATQSSPSINSLPSPSLGPSSAATGTKKPSKPKASATRTQPSTSALIICRNKHWRYISSFHGPWLQIPPEILETLANANYNAPRPHPVDPAVFFDLVKIRRLVEDATTLAVRAASGVAGSSHNLGNLGLGYGQAGGGNPGKLSRERKHRMREQATQKLSRAYHIDEIACSVATMQSASTLEDVASLVLQRSKEDADAKYVHFFHEKIPSRQLAECTSLDPLNEIIASRPTEAEPLRTRATVRIFKEDYDGAAMDLTAALNVHRFNQPPSHRTAKAQTESRELQLATDGQRSGRREDIILREEEHPSSFEQQALFQRGGCYLTLACQHVEAALLAVPQAQQIEETTPEEGQGPPTPPPEPSEEALRETHKKVLESRKLVKSYARKALRDYVSYLSHFEYSPDVPTEVAEDFAKRVNHAVHGLRIPRAHQHTPRPAAPTARTNGTATGPQRIYSLAELFAAAHPGDLPPYPRSELVAVTKSGNRQAPQPQPDSTGEVLTYHPLLTDALHSLLLCHCLVQTSSKELQRHANMVARLARLADGYPVFQASRSPARADWVEVLRKAENWISLSGSWETLCAPAPLPVFPRPSSSSSSSSAPHPSQLPPPPPPPETEKQRGERLHHQAMLRALEDDRVTDLVSLRKAVDAHKRRAEEDELRAKDLVEGDATASASASTQQANAKKETSQQQQKVAVPRRWAIDDGKEYPILTERAAAVARWVLEALPVGADGGASGGRKKKKKPAAKAAAPPSVSGTEVGAEMDM